MDTQDTVVVRQAALIALAFNLIMVVAAIISIMLTVPKVVTLSNRVK